MAEVQSWPELAEGLRELPEQRWYWLDLEIGIPASLCTMPDEATWRVGDLVARAIEPWLPFVLRP